MNQIKILSRHRYAKTDILDKIRGKRKTVYATKIVDITPLCPRTVSEGGRAILKYMTTTSGRLVQCCSYDKPNENLGTGTVGLFSIEKGKPSDLVRQSAFVEFAFCVGISPTKLACVVFKNIPVTRS